MTVKNVANLVAQTVDSFILQLSYTSMAFIALVLILIFKYGLPAMINIVHTEMQNVKEEREKENDSNNPLS